MKTLHTAIILSFGALLMSSQVIDKEAKTLLEAVKKKYTAYNSIQVKFKMTNIDKASNLNETEDGMLYLKAKMFKLDMADVEITTNGKDLWVYLKGSNLVQISDYDPQVMEQEFGIVPDEIFSIQQEDFDYRISGEATVSQKECKEIELSPKDKEKFYYKVKMYISKASNEVMRAHFFEKDGVEYKFDILQQTPNKVLGDELFTFDPSKYENIEIEDLRGK